jgi:hypothetical protein
MWCIKELVVAVAGAVQQTRLHTFSSVNIQTSDPNLEMKLASYFSFCHCICSLYIEKFTNNKKTKLLLSRLDMLYNSQGADEKLTLW